MEERGIAAATVDSTDYVMIFGEISSFDWHDPQVLSVRWSLSGNGTFGLEVPDIDLNLLPVNRAVNVYLNDVSEPVFSYDPMEFPSSPAGKQLIVDSLSSFNTEHSTEYCLPEYYAPRDCYTFSAFAFVLDSATNESITTVLTIANDRPGDFSVSRNGEISISHISHNLGGHHNTTDAYSYTISPTITRPRRTQALIYFMFSVNWLLALCSMIATAFVFDWNGTMKDGVALLPITVILAIPAIRSLYVGSPPFGIFLDTVGFFPQMLAVTMCIVVILFGVAKQYKWDAVAGDESGEASVGWNNLKLQLKRSSGF